MNKHKHTINLSKKEHLQLQIIIHAGKHNARVITRARILLKTNSGLKNQEIACQLDIGESTVKRAKAHYRDGGLKRALYDAPRTGQPKKLNDIAEAHLVALACSDPPEGYDRWTLELLKKQMIKDGKIKKISTVALWNYLTERSIKPWREKNVVYTKDNA